MSKKDNIYADQLEQVESFNFDQKVVEVFPDMIKRSVPGYTAIIDGIGQLAKKIYTSEQLGLRSGLLPWCGDTLYP